MTDEEVAAEKKTSVAAVVKEEKEPHADFEDYVEDALERGNGAGRGDSHASQWRLLACPAARLGARSAFRSHGACR